MMKPKCLPTVNAYVFLPCDHTTLSGRLESLVHCASKLYVYAAIYSKQMADEIVQNYKLKLERTLPG